MTQTTIIFFDLDSTLVENKFSQKVIHPLLEELTRASGKNVQELARELGQENTRRQKTDPDHVLTMDWHDIIKTIAQRYEVALSQSLDERWQALALIDDIEILDDAPAMLQTLQADHRKLVLATKGLSKYQNPILKVTGLDHYFDNILTPDNTGFLKTSPGYFEQYQPQSALFIQVGDHYYDDVICAKRNGFYNILRAPIKALKAYDPFDRPKVLEQYFDKLPTYPEGGSEVRPDAVVISLQEVPDIVARIEAKHAG
jgi:FMN phosphatase YigB (HAD superfamily)